MPKNDTEQLLREEIASQKATIADLPSLSSIVEETGFKSPETKARAELNKELSDNEEQLEILLESKRVAAVVRLQDELHPPECSEDCPICLETIKHVNSKKITRFHCCGGLTCVQCANERRANFKKEGFDDMFRSRCPLCRERIPGESKKVGVKVLEHANRGRAWAQFQIGTWYSDEMLGKKYGFPFDKEKGLQFLKQAADQRDSDALLGMAVRFFSPDRDESKHMYYLKEAADLGDHFAQYYLADAYESQKDDKGHLHYITLAASEGDPNACGVLRTLFMSGDCGLAKSLILAKHYFGKSLKDTEYVDSEYQEFACKFAIALYELGCERYEDILEIPAHSPIPKSIFWLRRALEGDSYHAVIDLANKTLLSQIEKKAKSNCANCLKEAGCSSFMRCARCSGAWYCRKECQIQHWKAGHKIDCIKRK